MKLAFPDAGRGSGVYRIVNTIDNKVYIGSSKSLSRRLAAHIRRLEAGNHHSPHLQRAWSKHGRDAFLFEKIEDAPPKELVEREQYWIDQYQSFDKNRGYNVSPTAYSSLGRKDSPEVAARKAAHLSTVRNNDNPITRQKIREALTGRKRPPHVGEAVRRAKLGKPGRKLSDAEKAARSARLKEEWARGDRMGKTRLWIVEAPNGDRFEVSNIKRLCAERGIGNASGFSNVRVGRLRSLKGWRAWHADEPEPIFVSRGPRSNSGRKPLARRLIDPAGKAIEASDLRAFCQENNLSYGAMCSVAAGRQYEHRGWRSPAWGDKPAPVGNVHGERFIMTSPEGEEFEIQNLAAFCREHGLTRANLSKVMRGVTTHHKGWRCRKP